MNSQKKSPTSRLSVLIDTSGRGVLSIYRKERAYRVRAVRQPCGHIDDYFLEVEYSREGNRFVSLVNVVDRIGVEALQFQLGLLFGSPFAAQTMP
jgi:hypothetical protein